MPVPHARRPRRPLPPRRRAPGRLGLALLTLAALLGGVPARAAAVDAADGPGWTAEPAAGRAGAAVRPYFYLAGAPGTVLEDSLALANPTDQEHTVTLRGADAYDTADGAFAVRPAAKPGPDGGSGSGAGSWISFGRGAAVRLPARARAVVPFTVTLPSGSPPGDHPAALVVTEATEAGQTAQAGEVAQAARAGREVAVRVHLRVGGPAVAALTVEDVAVRGRAGAEVITYTLVNRGNVPLTPTLAVRADGSFGEVPGRAPHALPVELLPGRRIGLTEPWPGAPQFDRVRLTLTVTAPGAARATAAASAWCLPRSPAARTGLGLLALGGTTAAALLLVRTRRNRRSRDLREDPAPPPRPDERSRQLTGASR
ncbi:MULTISPECIES: hypothetical protein [unclassified Streptomyces]|uniref:hypothetical protein n=1 Tax=unclassified Streptomyces TaxID=2593676 RepID=UPI002E36E7FA|nr:MULTISPECIES: hypothetical protein [unclassified Streptomyces]WUC66164.1 hypothetical protein OG861_19065 [Streptomyces sp. NBC_00539]